MRLRDFLPKRHGYTILQKRFWIQLWDKCTQGYDDSELWSLDYTITKFIAPRLRAFIEIGPEIAVPQSFLDAEYQKSLAKGYKWNSRWVRMDNRRENKRCWERARKEWKNILEHMLAGFEDIILEEQDWDAWNKKWEPVVKKCNKRLDNAKTPKEKQAILHELNPWATYFPNRRVCTDDVVYNMRRLSKDLLAMYYDSLWY